ncbi:hypothetical protein ONS95_002758 [Cadophora gregata]|uniref:uncharacterized protein n=1 Tax=Cadophora gregata TaxID=51156 RepID=UPI0026DB5E36|nr:uncharacterized protein ONS95_002758 [Cadophora gregata]KAK0110102.1 hypothetical protein ONS95_002758 [Cadophora gregata]
MQNELNDLERELDALDKQDGRDEILQARLRGFDGSELEGWTNEQQTLCMKIQEKYVIYAEVLLKDASLRALGKPPPRNHMANFRWMHNTKALKEDKRDFLNHPDDFVSISRHSDRRFEDFIESWLDKRGPNFFIKVSERSTS